MLLSKGSLPTLIEANTMTSAFEKRKGFFVRWTGKETGFGVEFKSLGKDGLACRSAGGAGFNWRALAPDLFWTTDPSERIPVIKFQSSPSSLVPWGGGGTLVPGVID